MSELKIEKSLPKNRYTTIDLTNYYKEWDGQCYLGPRVKYTFQTVTGDRVELVFLILNHSLAIQWLKNLNLDLIDNKAVLNNNQTIGFGETALRDVPVITDVWCFAPDEINATRLVLDIHSTQQIADMYDICSHKTYSTNVILKYPNYNKPLHHAWQKNSPEINVVTSYNKKYQDRELMVDVDAEQYNNINTGSVTVGRIHYHSINGEVVMAAESTPISEYNGNLNEATLVDIKIGSFLLPWE